MPSLTLAPAFGAPGKPLLARGADRFLPALLLSCVSGPARRVHFESGTRYRSSQRLTTIASRIAKFGFNLLLGFAPVAHAGFAVSLQATAAPAKSSCCCSGCDMKRCATPACCAKPPQPSAPFTPTPAPTSRNDWQALAASVSRLLAVPSPSADELSAPGSFFLVLSIPRGPIKERYAGWNRLIV